mgnify:FL=1|tara:strand:- start:4476 stop:6293 length:1818 start_codon:yes stop_codon:yes gene_type:complete
MSTNGNIPIGGNHDYQDNGGPINIQAGSQSGDAVEIDQLNTALAGKQGNLSGGSGIDVDGDTVNIELSSSAVDNSVLTISGASNAVLDGNYTRASYEAHLEYLSGTDGCFNLRYGGDFAFFYKDNGNSTWSVVGANDIDGNANHHNQWYGAVSSINPATVSADVLNYIVNSNVGVGGIQDQYTNSHDLDENSKRVPTAADSQIAYGAGASDSFLSFDAGKLKVEVANSMSNASSTNLVNGAVTKTYIDEAEYRAEIAANNSFSNTTAQLDGNPSNVQAMGEALAAKDETLESDIQGLQTTQSTINSRQTSLLGVVGVAASAADMGTWSGTGAAFLTDNSTAKEGIEGAATGAVTALNVLGTVLGLGQGESDFGDGFTILPNDEDAKALFQAVETELQALAAGAGATWPAGTVQSVHESNISDLDNPGTDVFGGETLSQGDVFLAAGQTAKSQNGFYVFDTTSTALVRWIEAYATEEFIQNRSVQIVRNGTEWAYKGAADPVVDTNVLPFEKIRDSIIADQAISEPKLNTDLQTKINAKSDVYGEDVTLVGNTDYNVSHGLDSSDVIVQFRDSSGEVTGVEITIDSSSQITLRSGVGVSGRVVVIG